MGDESTIPEGTEATTQAEALQEAPATKPRRKRQAAKAAVKATKAKSRLSPAARKRIADAQKRRWAAYRKAKATGRPVATVRSSTNGHRKVTVKDLEAAERLVEQTRRAHDQARGALQELSRSWSSQFVAA